MDISLSAKEYIVRKQSDDDARNYMYLCSN